MGTKPILIITTRRAAILCADELNLLSPSNPAIYKTGGVGGGGGGEGEAGCKYKKKKLHNN